VNTELRCGIGRNWVLACSAVFLLSVSVAAVLAASPPQSSKSADARKDYALIYGTVWGADNHPLTGVSITIRRAADKKPKWELVSDKSGEFAQRVPAGTQDYIVQANVKTAKGQPKPEATVHIDNDERRDVGIHLSK
jgi:hypothetical protein